MSIPLHCNICGGDSTAPDLKRASEWAVNHGCTAKKQHTPWPITLLRAARYASKILDDRHPEHEAAWEDQADRGLTSAAVRQEAAECLTFALSRANPNQLEAAPDLLEACKYLVEYFALQDEPPFSEVFAVIAKAEGK